ncbi:MAG TPA: hypothetical protein DEA08_07240, partial [Planctomycetes bacterium]|nr:hypothetical protein [Planctomycetota bacterium]
EEEEEEEEQAGAPNEASSGNTEELQLDEDWDYLSYWAVDREGVVAERGTVLLVQCTQHQVFDIDLLVPSLPDWLTTFAESLEEELWQRENDASKEVFELADQERWESFVEERFPGYPRPVDTAAEILMWFGCGGCALLLLLMDAPCLYWLLTDRVSDALQYPGLVVVLVGLLGVYMAASEIVKLRRRTRQAAELQEKRKREE